MTDRLLLKALLVPFIWGGHGMAGALDVTTAVLTRVPPDHGAGGAAPASLPERYRAPLSSAVSQV
jgi:hypothetical protein